MEITNMNKIIPIIEEKTSNINNNNDNNDLLKQQNNNISIITTSNNLNYNKIATNKRKSIKKKKTKEDVFIKLYADLFTGAVRDGFTNESIAKKHGVEKITRTKVKTNIICCSRIDIDITYHNVLHGAAFANDFDAVYFLLRDSMLNNNEGPSPLMSEKNSDGLTPMEYVLEKRGNVLMFKMLYLYLSMKKETNEGETLIPKKYNGKDKDVEEWVVENQPFITKMKMAKKSYEKYKKLYPASEPFIVACERGKMEDVKLFVKYGMVKDINMVGKNSWGSTRTPIGIAAQEEQYEIVQFLLSIPNITIGAIAKDCNCCSHSYTAIMWAARHNQKNLDVLNLLFNHKTFSIDVLNKKNRYGNTALDWAEEYNQSSIKNDVIELLKSKNNADDAMGQKKKKEEGEQKVDKNDLISLYMVSK